MRTIILVRTDSVRSDRLGFFGIPLGRSRGDGGEQKVRLSCCVTYGDPMRLTALISLSLLAGCPGKDLVIDTDVNRLDRDDDGFNESQDCDDSDPEINPEAEDTVGDEVDNNCDGVDGVDEDGDGFASEASGGEDCDDDTRGINPDVADIPWNDVDEDCNGADMHAYGTIGVGDRVSCAIRTTAELDCWGADTAGEVSDRPTTTGWTVLGGGLRYMCGIREGSIECWGDDEFGIVSDVPAGTNWEQLSAGVRHACAINNLGAAACWGDDEFLQVSMVPAQEMVQIAPGDRHTCGAVESGNGIPVCWGDDSFDQAVPDLGTYLQLDSGDDHTCGILQDRTLKCWGRDNFGQNNPANRKGPYTDISAAGDSACGILSATTLECWGANNFGQIAPPDFTALDVEMGPTHGCALNGAGIVFCWGDNGDGQTDVP